MHTQLVAGLAAVHSAAERLFDIEIRYMAGLAVVGALLAGCAPRPGVPLAAADPQAKVAAVGYRSTVAPYVSLRPTTPSSWRQLNDSVAPSPKSGH
jgi:hypothetical protein